MGFVLTLSVFCCVFNYQIIDFRYDNNILEASQLLTILMICFVCVSSTYIYGTLLTANGNLYHLNIVAGFGVLLNIILNFILIPRYQALGSAIASLITQFLTGLAQIILCYYFFRLHLWSSFIRVIIFLAGVLTCAFYVDSAGELSYYSILFYFTFSFVWLFITRLINVSDFYLLISTKLK